MRIAFADCVCVLRFCLRLRTYRIARIQTISTFFATPCSTNIKRRIRSSNKVSLRFCSQCSIRVCHGDSASNRREIDDFEERIGGRGTAVYCYYDPQRISSGAVLHVIPVGSHVLHALLWPAAASIAGVTACVVFCRWCRRQEAVSIRRDSQVALQATPMTTGPVPPLETTTNSLL